MNGWVGRSLGKVRIDSLLARGGMAEVFLGEHTTLQREVAIKILRNQYADDADLLERFQREARVVAKLRHQNIVQVFDYDTVDDHPYIVMEYVSGPSLSQYLTVLHKNKKRLELSEVSKILTGVANALQYAHNSGVIHRDIKPGNIILTSHTNPIIPGEPLPEDFEPVLTDFGLVRFLNSSRQTSAGETAGTPAYMSPEQARGETTDGRTDIYSLGVVVYEMLAGNVPFDGETTMSVLLKHITDAPRPISGLSYSLQKVLDKALAKNLVDRFQKPTDFAISFKTASEEGVERSTYTGISPVFDLTTIPDRDPSLIIVDTVKKPRKWWVPVTISVLALALFGGVYLAKGFIPSTPSLEPPTASQAIPTTAKPSVPIISNLGTTAILHFRDGDTVMDQVVLEILAMPAPPAGTQYEAWLTNSTSRLRLGIITLDATGKGLLTFNAGQNENLLALYDHVEITLKPLDASSSDIDPVAYSYTLPPDGLAYLRQLMVNFPDVPEQTALIQGLFKDTKILKQNAETLATALNNNDLVSIKRLAESILNVIAGGLNQDWDGDGQINNPGNGYGFQLNGNNLGYIQAIYAHADYAVNSPGASQYMITHGSEVKICAENLAAWTTQLQEETQKILQANAVADTNESITKINTLIAQISDGVDLDSNGAVDPVTGECGVDTAYSSTYSMADMPLLPVNLLTGTGTPTETPTSTGGPSTFATSTATRKPSSGGGAAPTRTKNQGGGGGGQPTKKKP